MNVVQRLVYIAKYPGTDENAPIVTSFGLRLSIRVPFGWVVS